MANRTRSTRAARAVLAAALCCAYVPAQAGVPRTIRIPPAPAGATGEQRVAAVFVATFGHIVLTEKAATIERVLRRLSSAKLGLTLPGLVNFGLYVAVESGDPAKVDLFLRLGAPVDGSDPHRPPINRAIYFKRNEIVWLLLKRKAAVEGPSAARKRPIMVALETGNDHAVRLLAENGADINGSDERGRPVWTAIATGNTPIALWLLKRGAKTTFRCNGVSPREFALRRGMAQVAKAISAPDKGSMSIWELAGLGHAAELQKVPVERLRQADAVLRMGLLDVAARNGQTRVVELLATRGLIGKGPEAQRALCLAADGGHWRTAEKLRTLGVGVETSRVLAHAIQSGSKEMIQWALKHRGNVNLPLEVMELSPMQLAAMDGNIELLGLLIHRGALLNALSADHRTPLDFARDLQTRVYLRRHGALRAAELPESTRE